MLEEYRTNGEKMTEEEKELLYKVIHVVDTLVLKVKDISDSLDKLSEFCEITAEKVTTLKKQIRNYIGPDA